jgi:hypothetical protein
MIWRSDLPTKPELAILPSMAALDSDCGLFSSTNIDEITL